MPVYRLNDLQDEEIKGTFYESEMQKVNYDPDHSFKINRIIKTRGKGQNKQYFVQWKYYPKKFNSWVKANDLQRRGLALDTRNATNFGDLKESETGQKMHKSIHKNVADSSDISTVKYFNAVTCEYAKYYKPQP
ncbi:uncharacterized protein LOC128558917 [Mercenaria mercenaria]|uniref:uncharacterized protein LOC128558917 n=1 Tax=Mercenaria mercenaria TaxID=6596 RepID=UPI00234F753C|nr:uncharacterized protein LOC128558917 [Mercenaria mercenaria]